MKKTVNYLAIVSCFTLGASLAHAEPMGHDEPMHGGQMPNGQMHGQMEDKMFKDADTNGDGRPDLVAANAGDGTLSVLLSDGAGSFQSQKVFQVGYQPEAVAVADINGDGRPDLVAANSIDDTVSVLLNNADGAFTGPGGPRSHPQDTFTPSTPARGRQARSRPARRRRRPRPRRPAGAAAAGGRTPRPA